jgi:hypothetical protein
MRIKESLVVYLEQRIIVLPLHLYLDTLLTRVIDRLSDWNLLNKKITGKEKFFKFFVEKEILDIILEIKIVYKELNLKILTVYKDFSEFKKLSEYFEENNFVSEVISKICKKLFKNYFKKLNSNNLNFKPSNKIYKGLNCGDPTGEEIEFLTKLK